MKEQHVERGDPLCRFFKNVQKRDFARFFVVAVRSFTADSSLLQPKVGVNSTLRTSHFAHFFTSITRTRVAQVVSLACAHHVSCVISMRSCCVFDSLRLLHFPLFAVHLLSYHPVFLPSHQLHLPRCGGQFPCALQLLRTLAPLPSTTLSHFRAAIQEQLRYLPLIFQHLLTSKNRIGSSRRVIAIEWKNIRILIETG